MRLTGESFTFEELSKASGIPVSKLKAYHRNLSRTAQSLGRAITEGLPADWYGSRQHYRVMPKLEAAARK